MTLLGSLRANKKTEIGGTGPWKLTGPDGGRVRGTRGKNKMGPRQGGRAFLEGEKMTKQSLFGPAMRAVKRERPKMLEKGILCSRKKKTGRGSGHSSAQKKSKNTGVKT